MAGLEKARIFDPDSSSYDSDDIFRVQFNPNTLQYSVSLGGRAQKGVQGQAGSGTQGEPHTQQSPIAEPRGALLSVTLFFHTYNGPNDFTDVRAYVNGIRAFLPAPSAQNGSSSPRITFAWGTMTHTSTLESFQASYQMFARDGTPVQAEVSISIRGEDPDVAAESANQALGTGSEEESEQEDDDSYSDEYSWLF